MSDTILIQIVIFCKTINKSTKKQILAKHNG